MLQILLLIESIFVGFHLCQNYDVVDGDVLHQVPYSNEHINLIDNKLIEFTINNNTNNNNSNSKPSKEIIGTDR